MRKLMWFTIGFLAACLLATFFWLDSELIAAFLGFGVTCAACFALSKKYGWLRRLGAVCLGLAVGFGWYQVYSACYLQPVYDLDGEKVSLTVQCIGYSDETTYGTAVDGLITVENKPYRARIYLEGTPKLEPGDIITGEFELRRVSAENTYRQGNGVFLSDYQASDAQMGKPVKMPWYCRTAVLRQEILNLLDECFPDDTAGFAKALLLGDRGSLDYETSTALRLSGISHIVAVSGLHVSILFSVVFALGLHRGWPTALIGIPILVSFAAVAGFSPSITRACIMQILMIVALCLEKDYDPPTALSFAVLVMLVANPMTVLSISFQLSVGCIAGILLFRERIQGYLRRYLPKSIADSTAVTISAISLTTPLAALYFDCVSLITAVTNLLVLWVVTFIFCGILLVCLMALLWSGGAAVLAWILSWPIRYVLVVAKILSRFPLAAVYTCNFYVVVWLVFVYVLVAVFLLQKRKQPVTLLCCGILSLLLAVGIGWAEPMMDDCRVTVLDVGQGQCILLQSEGRTWMVDCGGSDDERAADAAADTLLSQGITRLDGVILTHYDWDHAGGVVNLLTRIPADTVLLPDMEDLEDIGGRIENGVLVDRDMTLAYGTTALTAFAPMKGKTGNESSLCVLFRAANCDILITGDRSALGEAVLMQHTVLPKLEILIAGHHGSAKSTSEELLTATRPAIVAISAGENNPYGHPSGGLLARLTQYGCAVFRTDLDGNLIFRR